ncbi:rhoptry protein [Plasmodium gonderi]|uniref:Rhoptry protein n=1 Tax=Plasmodium gonderi TaxID=77519 RepID=A0A1Y1JI28_PLAGO|nr:rhoptry protein [Plasmodium gonderi]GAW81890.1 rhoptry protein [Plasmodium gonderi]
MEHPSETMTSTRILINNKEIDQEKGLRKFTKWINDFFKNSPTQSSTSDAFPYNNKILRNTFWSSQIIYTRIILLACFFSFVVSWKQYVLTTPLCLFRLFYLAWWNGPKRASVLFYRTVSTAPFLLPLFYRTFFTAPFLRLPSLSLSGMALSMGALLLNQINVLTLLPIYIILQSIYSIGNIWFNYVFEIELLELFFLTLFLVPLWNNHLKRRYSSSCFIKYTCRFFVFKVLLGTGLIRFKNSELWGKLEGKYYLYETQPLPSIIGYFLHTNMIVSKMDNLFCILTECVFSFFLLFPIRSFRIIGGSFILIYCILNFLMGNSYLFYFLLLAPLAFCFDDEILLPFFCKYKRNEILSVIRDKETQLNQNKQYFRSFDVLYCTGLNIEEVNKIREAYFSIDSVPNDDWNGNNWNGNNWNGTMSSSNRSVPPNEEGYLLSRDKSIHETKFFKNENKFESIKNDLFNALHWIFSQKGLKYIMTNYNIPTEVTVHAMCMALMIMYNSCMFITYSSSFSISLFFLYLILFIVYLIYLFFFTVNIFPLFIGQMGLLISVIFIYTNKIFFLGFSDIYYTTLFCMHLFGLLVLSLFYLSNKRFITKFTSQYFYFVFFIYFVCFFMQNILSPQQIMNAEYGNFQIMNVYGSFGKIRNVRQEIIVKASASNISISSKQKRSGEKDKTKKNYDEEWNNYQFNCKPDNVYKPLCTQFRFLFSFLPVLYVDRLDWQFNNLSDFGDDEDVLQTQWFQRFLTKLSFNDKNILSLLYRTPSFVDASNEENTNSSTPVYLTVSSAVYKFSSPSEKDTWWDVVSSRVILDQWHPLSTENKLYHKQSRYNDRDNFDDHGESTDYNDERINFLRYNSSYHHFPNAVHTLPIPASQNALRGSGTEKLVEAVQGGDYTFKGKRNSLAKRQRFLNQGKLQDEKKQMERVKNEHSLEKQDEMEKLKTLHEKIAMQKNKKHIKEKKKFFKNKKIQELQMQELDMRDFHENENKQYEIDLWQGVEKQVLNYPKSLEDIGETIDDEHEQLKEEDGGEDQKKNGAREGSVAMYDESSKLQKLKGHEEITGAYNATENVFEWIQKMGKEQKWLAEEATTDENLADEELTDEVITDEPLIDKNDYKINNDETEWGKDTKKKMLKKSKENVNNVTREPFYKSKKFSVNENVKRKLDEAIKNAHTKYGLLQKFSNKIKKLGFFNGDQGRSRYAEVKELNAKK